MFIRLLLWTRAARVFFMLFVSIFIISIPLSSIFSITQKRVFYIRNTTATFLQCSNP